MVITAVRDVGDLRYTSRVYALLLAVILLLCIPQAAYAEELDLRGITAAGMIVIDFDTGMELFAHNADARIGPASMTKMMTVYIIYEAIANGQIGLDTVVPISQLAFEQSRNVAQSNVPLSRSETFTVDELLDVVIVVSAGGATTALVELVAGTTRSFLVLMNAKAQEWGIDATFTSAVSGSVDTLMTPRAMAEITRNMINRFPEVLEKTSMESVTFRGHTYPSTNHLLGVYEGLDGFKTGTHPNIGANFAGTALRGDVRIITVTMASTVNGRFPDTEILLDYGFARMEEYLREARKVSPEGSMVIVNGVAVGVEAYSISGYSYFNIRDLAYVLRGTSARFNVVLDVTGGVIALTSGAAYSVIGSELSEKSGDRKLPAPLGLRLVLDGREVALSAFEIGGGVYLRLIELWGALGSGELHRFEGEGVIYTITSPPAAQNEPPPLVSYKDLPAYTMAGFPAVAKVPVAENNPSFVLMVVFYGIGILLAAGVAVCVFLARRRI